MASTTVAYHSGLTYGVGVDTPSGEARNIAATGTPNPILNASGDIISFSMMQIETVEDLHTSLGISASASGGVGLFSASARFDYAQSCDVHESSVFLMVRVKVNQAFSQIDKPGIDPVAAEVLANGGVGRFQDQYGDMFVRGLETGGLFFATIQIFCKDQTEKESVQVKVSGSYAAFSASGGFSQDFSDTVKTHKTQVLCYIEGGDPAKPLPVEVESMTTRAINFPSELKDRGIPYAALLDSYSILPLPDPPNYIDLQHQKDVLTECSLLRDQNLLVLNNINYILSNPDQFVDPEKYPLSQTRNDVDADLNTIAAAASNALNHPKEAVLPQLKLTGPITLPQRRAVVLVDLGALAARGEAIANADSLVTALRENEPVGPSRQGFDIGMAACEGQTLWGPGKQRIKDSLSPDQRVGFNNAIAFSLQRNNNADLADTGEAIVKTDPTLAAARALGPIGLYWLGFDIATGIFGDPAHGALGHTAIGPGAEAIRATLGVEGVKGFNDAMALNLSRKYK